MNKKTILIMNKFSMLLLLFLMQAIIALGQTKDTSCDINKIIPLQINHLELPKTTSTDAIIRHTGYSILYNEAHEQATWVAYELTKEETIKKVDRKNKFIPDPLVLTKSADGKDYAGTIYDRGHLAPAADMLWSSTAMKESFYYSNMSPQDRSFNRGIWKRLEELVRHWAVDNESVYIVTGPVLSDGLLTIGPNKVSVPEYYYKVMLDYKHPGINGIGFIIPNKASQEPLNHFAVSIDSVEKFTGIDFFPLLPDEQENIIETSVCFDCWSSTDTNTVINIKKAEINTPVQCIAKTKAGKRCKNRTSYNNRKCNTHGGK